MTCFQTGEVLEKNITFGDGGTQLFKTTVFKQVEVVGVDTSLASILILLGEKTKIFNFCCLSKVATEDIFSYNFVYKRGKTCCCQPTAVFQSPVSCDDVLIKTCLMTGRASCRGNLLSGGGLGA